METSVNSPQHQVVMHNGEEVNGYWSVSEMRNDLVVITTRELRVPFFKSDQDSGHRYGILSTEISIRYINTGEMTMNYDYTNSGVPSTKIVVENAVEEAKEWRANTDRGE